MKELKLANSDLVALVDDEDYERLSAIKWHINKTTGYVYGYFSESKPRLRLLHRVVLGLPPKNPHVDHKNLVRHDCQKDNLRVCTNQQNCCNRVSVPDTTSEYKGVSWTKREQKWRAAITDHFRSVHIGYFDNEVDAARAYDAEAIKRFGEFARLNFPDFDYTNYNDPIARRPPKSSKYPGVRRGQYNRWIATYRKNGKTAHIGCFGSEEEAYQAVLKAKAELCQTQ